MTDKNAIKLPNKLSLRTITPVLGIIFVLVLFSILTRGKIVTGANLEVIINQAFSVCVIGIGGMFVFAHGGLDFSVGSCMGMCSFIVSSMLLADMPAIFAVMGSILFGVLSGFLVGATSEFLGLTPFIASLCFNYIWRGLLQVFLGYDTISVSPAFCTMFNSWALKLTTLLIVFLIGAYLFNRTRIGKYQKAIGGSPVVARLSGVAASRYVILSHMIMGICVGIASVFGVARAAQVYPQTGLGYEIDVLVACVLGGMPLNGGAGCKMQSVVIGALTVATLTNGLTLLGINPNAVDGITGVIFIAVVALSYRRTRGQLIL